MKTGVPMHAVPSPLRIMPGMRHRHREGGDNNSIARMCARSADRRGVNITLPRVSIQEKDEYA